MCSYRRRWRPPVLFISVVVVGRRLRLRCLRPRRLGRIVSQPHARSFLYQLVSKCRSPIAGCFCPAAHSPLRKTSREYGESRCSCPVLSVLVASLELGKDVENSQAGRDLWAGGLPSALSFAPEDIDATPGFLNVRCELCSYSPPAS